MANWGIALVLCSLAGTACAACTEQGSATCSATDEHALVQKDLTVVNAHKFETSDEKPFFEGRNVGGKADETEFEFLGLKYKFDGPFAYCKVSPYPTQCAIAMAPQVLLPGGSLNANRPWLNEDGTEMNEEQKEAMQEKMYQAMVKQAKERNETIPTTTPKPTTATTTLVPPKVQVADKGRWLRENDWCPKGVGAMMVGLQHEDDSELIKQVVQMTDAEAEAVYLETLSKVQAQPTMGVIYPKTMNVDLCLMYNVLKDFRGVSFVDFDKDGLVAKYHKKDHSHTGGSSSKKKPAETHKTEVAKPPKSSVESKEESAGSRVAFGISTLTLAVLAFRF